MGRDADGSSRLWETLIDQFYQTFPSRINVRLPWNVINETLKVPSTLKNRSQNNTLTAVHLEMCVLRQTTVPSTEKTSLGEAFTHASLRAIWKGRITFMTSVVYGSNSGLGRDKKQQTHLDCMTNARHTSVKFIVPLISTTLRESSQKYIHSVFCGFVTLRDCLGEFMTLTERFASFADCMSYTVSGA